MKYEERKTEAAQLRLVDPAGPSLAQLAKRHYEASIRIRRLRHDMHPAEEEQMRDEALADRLLCATALAAEMHNMTSTIVGRDDDVGRWEVRREYGRVITARPYVDGRVQRLPGDSA